GRPIPADVRLDGHDVATTDEALHTAKRRNGASRKLRRIGRAARDGHARKRIRWYGEIAHLTLAARCRNSEVARVVTEPCRHPGSHQHGTSSADAAQSITSGDGFGELPPLGSTLRILWARRHSSIS